MITRIKTALLSIAMLSLSACGFTPMHAPAGLSDGAFNAISTELAIDVNIQDKEAAFWVQQALRDRLGSGDDAKHILRIKPTATRAGIGISGADIATRYDSGLNVSYELIDKKSGKLLNRGTVRSVSTFSASTDPYALTASEKASVRSLAKDSADRMLVKLAGYYAKARS